jgi:hypothetical protein
LTLSGIIWSAALSLILTAVLRLKKGKKKKKKRGKIAKRTGMSML